jgi:hypothetical protein
MLRTFRLSAAVSSANLEGIRAPLEAFLGRGARITRTEAGFTIDAPAIVGIDPRELNRRLLSALRRVDKMTRIRSEWTVDGVVEKFADYVRVKDRAR